MLMVVMMHLGLARGESHFIEPNLPVGAFTGIAMPMFFMVSGYLMCKKDVVWGYSGKKIWGIIRFCIFVCIPLSIALSFTSGEITILFPQCLIQKGRIAQFWYFGSMIIIYAILPYLIKVIRSKWLKMTLLGVAFFCSVVFALNILYGFEKHIIQTFRLWNWLFYFLLGAFIHQNEASVKWIKWYYIIPSLAIYILFFQIIKIGGNEYYFCSPVCMIHSTICFVGILNLNISGSSIIGQLSNCFLPIYTFHTYIEVFWCSKTPLFSYFENTLPTSTAYIIEYCIVAITCIIFSLILMRMPYMTKIFKI